MFERKIEFLALPFLLEDKKLYPEPTNKFLPEWFKDLPISYGYVGNKKSILNKTIKSCMPFLDALKTGYIIKAPTDIYFNHNFDNPEKNNEKDTHIITNLKQHFMVAAKRLNINVGGEGHDPKQLGGDTCPFFHDNKGKKFFKILNPWVVKTPPGYSTLFIQHLNNPDKRFTPLAGIVDTDIFNLPVNFPIIMNQEGEWILEKYSPIISVFPFKRDNWKHEIKALDVNKVDNENFNYFTYIHGYYKNLIWKAKKWI
jgi:hypothetical protein